MVDFILPWGFMKKCSLCKESKELECFTTKSGNVTAKCKECLSKLQKEWKKKNPDKAKKIKQREYQKNKERCDKSNNKWAEENRERSNEIKKDWKEKHKEKYQEQQRKYQLERHYREPLKIKAVKLHNDRIRKGEIVRPTICSRCKEEAYIEGHHYDYNKPLDVIWLCRKCHAKERKKNKPRKQDG